MFVGGITGSIGTPYTGAAASITEASAVGNITVIGNFGRLHEGLCLGGLVGYIRGVGSGTLRAVLNEADYRQGIITITNDIGNLYIGGAVGMADGFTHIKNTAALQGDLRITKNGNRNWDAISVGGFIGAAYSLITGGPNTIEYCYAIGPINVSTTVDDVFIWAGGFAGDSESDISNCFAAGDVFAEGRYEVVAGGFVAVLRGTYTDCYATGNVTAIGNRYYEIFAGGFAGVINPNHELINSYAVGSVIARHNGTGNSFAGGLVGILWGNTTIQHSAALGASVTATAANGTAQAGRIYGIIRNTGNTFNNNRAFNGMVVNNNGAISIPSTTDDTSQHGANASGDDFRRRDIWQNLPTNTTIRGLGFSSTHWDFGTVDWRGRPTLRNVGGQ